MYIMCIYAYMNTCQPFGAVSQLPAALFVPEQIRPWMFWTRILSNVSMFIDLSLPCFFRKPLAIWSNAYASKTHIEILCKKMRCIARDAFPKSDFLSNSWKYRTLGRMSAWTTGCLCFFRGGYVGVGVFVPGWKAWRFLTNCQTILAFFIYTWVCIQKFYEKSTKDQRSTKARWKPQDRIGVY